MKLKNISFKKIKSPVTITLPALSWIVIFGNLHQSLQNKQKFGLGRPLIKCFVEAIEMTLKGQGFVDQEDIDVIHQLEKSFTISENINFYNQN